MSWTVDDIYKFTQFLTNKNQSGGISASDLFYQFNSEQSQYHQDIVGRWQRQANGKAGLNSGLIQSEVSIAELSPFILPFTIAIDPVTGIGMKPSDYIYAVALRINNAKVFNVEHDRIWAAEDDVIDPPSIPDGQYNYTDYDGYFQFMPIGVTTCSLDYVAEPTDVVWGFTLDAQNRPIYNPGTSTQPKWNKNVIIEITRRSLITLGVHFADQDFTQFGRSNVVTGD